MKQFLKHYSSNTKGLDFIVGDLHGCYTELKTALGLVQFNTTYDRLFSVGDLIDRGNESLECAKLLFEPWFYSVKGNHEISMYQSILDKDEFELKDWLRNGGEWHLTENPAILKVLSRKMKKLPLVITVGEGPERFNVLHGELVYLDENQYPVPFTDRMIDEWDIPKSTLNGIIQGRSIVKDGSKKFHNPDNLSLTFVGHTSFRHQPFRIEQQFYIDTGISYTKHSKHPSDWPLSLACWTDKTFYLYDKPKNIIKAVPFNEIEY